MKHIAIISTSYPPSIWNSQGRSTSTVAYGLARLGHNVTVFTFTQKKSFVQQDGQVTVRYIGDLISAISLPFSHIAVWNAAILSAMLLENFDTIVLMNAHGWDAAKEYKEKKSNVLICGFVPLLYTFTGWLQPLDPDLELQLKTREAEYIEGCDHLISHTSKFAEKLANYAGRSVYVIPNGYLSLSKMKDPIVSNKDPNQICFIGKVNREKSLERIIRVLPNLPNCTLKISSPESSKNYYTVLERLAKSLDVEHRVEFIGWISTKAARELYALSGLAIVPSQVEPYGYSALDPVSLKIPVVVSEWSGLGEYLADSGTVFSSLDGLTTCIKTLLEMTDEERAIHCKNNLDKLTSSFTEDTTSNLLESVICQT